MSAHLSEKNQREVKDYFNTIKHSLIKQYGNQPLDNIQITKICKQYLKSQYKATYCVDTLPLTIGMKIMNLSNKNSKGTHWVAIYITNDKTNKTLYFYDSFGRRSSKIAPIIYAKCKKKNIRVFDVNESIAFLLTINKYGIDSGFLV